MRSLPLPLIRRLVPLNGLNEHSLQVLLEHCECQLIGRGQRLFSQADFSQNHFFVLSGEAELQYVQGVVLHTPETLYPVAYGTAGFCSKQGLLAAKASTDCVLLRVDKQQLDKQLCWDNVAAAIELDLSYYAEHDDEVAWRLTLLKSNLFVKVPPLNIDHMFSRLKSMQVKAGDVILRQGEVGDGCYFIRRGAASVTRRQPGESDDRHLVDIGYGRCFGEDALVHETVRNATVTMSTDGLLMTLSKPDFMLLLREPEVEHVKAVDLDMAQATGALLLDIRTPDEFNVARLPAARNAALACLRLLMSAQLNLQHDYIVYCDTGRRSRAAAALLHKQGFRARYLLNGINALSSDQRQRFLDVVPPLTPMPAMATEAAFSA
jgi:rhodanese-related sulfurtransferase